MLGGHLPFFLGRLSSWVKIRLHTENQLPRLPGSALKVLGWWWGGGWMASYPLLSQAPTPVEAELGCDKNYQQSKESILNENQAVVFKEIKRIWRCRFV